MSPKVYLDALGTLVVLFISWAYLRKQQPPYPPAVGSMLPWIGSGLIFARDPFTFLDTCRKQYGHVFKLLLGGRRMIVVSSADAIAALLRDRHGTLDADVMHIALLRCVGAINHDTHRIHDILHHEIFPIIGRCFTRHSLSNISSQFSTRLRSQLDEAFSSHNQQSISLKGLVGRSLFEATSSAMLRPSFPISFYDDLLRLDSSIYSRLYKLPFFSHSSTWARHRLLDRLADYIEEIERDGAEGELMSGVLEVFKANKLGRSDKAGLMLVFIWGSHINPMNTTIWLLTYLLANREAMTKIREEVDQTIHSQFTSLDSLLAADPCVLDGPGFSLLDSAIRETMRLTVITTVVRRATCDTELKSEGRTIHISEGEHIMADVRAPHHDETTYPDAETFIYDRFVFRENSENASGQIPSSNQRAALTFFGWGSGKHICKGRHLAMYEVKLLVIILLHLYDMSLASGVLQNFPPKFKRRSLGVWHANEDVLVHLQRRHVSGTTTG
ncbi:cytochrome P450 [Hygrophoropsis aurantiaca]|uniref:Cytochrome P450 n=1 Tax=Hygrophoropsis aurantiaca TaxID=72124 RepID=A0ACB7ZZS1_9AGAM|nr:cytochrome P450 [Hygrophoropsis aurantiaca]